MALDFDIMYVKLNTILHVDAPSRQKFGDEKIENQENSTLGRSGYFASKSTENKNKTKPSTKQDSGENKEKYMDQLLNSRDLQRNKT